MMKNIYLIILPIIFLTMQSIPGYGQSNQKSNLPAGYSEEAKKIKIEAEQVISEYNKTAENVKYEAIKKNKNLSADTKKLIIEMEKKISLLEDKLQSINYQNTDNWTRFRDEIKNDISNIKNGIKNLSGEMS
jgi:hypothetical protein